MDWQTALGWTKRAWREPWFLPGRIIRHRYQLERGLGTGSYGVTYKCKDLLQKETCVLKRLSPLRGGHTRTARLYEQEVQILKQLEHKAVPRWIESFTYRDQLCFTMQFMEGDSLEALVFDKDQTFSEIHALQIIRKLLLVLIEIHRQGIIHRDISMANVLLHEDRVQLIDWGLAGFTAQPQDFIEDEVLNGDESLMKKLRRRLHPESDLYALGHLLLFLLYSAYPEQPDEAEERSWEDELILQDGTKKLLRRLLKAEQPYPDAKSALEDLDQLLKNPDDFFLRL